MYTQQQKDAALAEMRTNPAKFFQEHTLDEVIKRSQETITEHPIDKDMWILIGVMETGMEPVYIVTVADQLTFPQ